MKQYFVRKQLKTKYTQKKVSDFFYEAAGLLEYVLVSYTHLDVYKRQVILLFIQFYYFTACLWSTGWFCNLSESMVFSIDGVVRNKIMLLHILSNPTPTIKWEYHWDDIDLYSQILPYYLTVKFSNNSFSTTTIFWFYILTFKKLLPRKSISLCVVVIGWKSMK